MPTVSYGMVNIHRQRQNGFSVFCFVFTPSDNRSEIFPLVKNMYVKIPVLYPRQTRYVESVFGMFSQIERA